MLNENFVGIMDDVIVLSRALSQEEVQLASDQGFAAALSGGQLPGDCNQDGARDISDPVCLLGFLFTGIPPSLPCGDGEINAANLTLLDHNGDTGLDISDPVAQLVFLFAEGGLPPASGLDCISIAGCPASCIP